MTGVSRRVSVVLFDGFELLDVFGPIELLSMLPEQFRIDVVGPEAGPVRSSQGIEVVALSAYAQAQPGEIIMVPGGMGTRQLAEDQQFLAWLAGFASSAEFVASVCTGSALLAAAGLLEGYAATSNKRAYTWATQFGTDVSWKPQARWVEDRNRWTSSGVAAGMDMTAALIRALHGDEQARYAADRIELETHADPGWDPFAALYGLA